MKVGDKVKNINSGKIGIIIEITKSGSVVVLEKITPTVICTHDSEKTLKLIEDSCIQLQLENINKDKEQIEKYYDFKTSNKSFLKMYEELAEQGVKNNKFFLQIIDKDLIGVDPFSKNLTESTKQKIIKECINNYWYFIRECVRIPIIGEEIKQFELHKGNLAMAFCFLNNINQFAMLPTMCYTSISVTTMLLWNGFNDPSKLAYFDINRDYCESEMFKVDIILKYLPEYISKAMKNNIEPKYCKSNYSKNDIDNMCRGITNPIIWIDNFAFIKNNNVLLNSIMPVSNTNKNKLKGNSSIIITSVPGKPGTESNEFASMLFGIKCCNLNLFNKDFYDYNDEQIEKLALGGFVRIKYQYNELGKDDEWFQKMCIDRRNNDDIINREILLQWVL